MGNMKMPQPVDTLFQSYTRGLYKITGQEEEDSIMEMIDSNNPGATNSASMVIDPSTIGSGVMTGTVQTATGSQQQGKKLFTDTVQGYILGVDPKDGFAKFAIGNSISYLQWDGTTLTTTGTIVATDFKFKDASGTTVIQGGASGGASAYVIDVTTTANVTNGMRISMTQDTSTGILITTSSAVNGFYYTNSANVTNRGLYIEQTSTGANNTNPCAEIHNASNVGNTFGMLIVSSNAAGGILVQTAGSGAGMSIQTSSSNNALTIASTGSTGTTSQFVLSAGRGGYLIDLSVSIASGNPYGVRMSLVSGAGVSCFAFKFDGNEIISAAVVGVQNKKIKIDIGGAQYFIPCYDA